MGHQYKAVVLHAPKTPLVIETIAAEELKAGDVLVGIAARIGLEHVNEGFDALERGAAIHSVVVF